MIDPLTAATSVAGLLSLVIQVSQILYEQVYTVKNAPKDAQELLDEFELLRKVLRSLEEFLRTQALQGHSFKETSVLVSAIRGCDNKINAVKLRVEKLVRKQGFAQILERGKWYYEHDEHQELITSLHRYLAMFQISLNVDGM
jgi:Fungal N-terminal domain of STAND proteins